MDQAHEAQPLAGRGPFQHLLVAVGIAEGEDRMAPDDAIDGLRLARTVIDEEHLGLFDQRRACVPHLKLGDAGGADHLLGRDAVGLVGEIAHELDPAAGRDEGLEAVGAQIVEQLQHRLIDQVGVKHLEARMLGGLDPLFDRLVEIDGGHAGMRGGHDLQHALLAHGGDGFHVAGKHRLEWFLVLPFRMLVGLLLHLVDGEHELVVDRLLDPQRAVIVERGDALGRRHVIGPALLGHPRDEIDDRLLGRPVVPGRQRIVCAA